MDHRVRRELDPDVDHGVVGVDDRRAAEHQLLVDPALGHGSNRGQLHAIVDPECLVDVVKRQGCHQVALPTEQRQHVREVVLALGVVSTDPRQRRQQRRAGKGVYGDIDLFDLELVGCCILRPLGLHDLLHGAVLGADHAPVAGGVVKRSGEDRRRRAGVSCWARARDAMVSGMISGTSPASTTTEASWSMCATCAARSASAVPSACSWTTLTTSSPSSDFSGSPGASTTTILAAPAVLAAATTQPIIGSPQTSCRSLGVFERIRVPWPAARMTTTGPLTRRDARRGGW